MSEQVMDNPLNQQWQVDRFERGEFVSRARLVAGWVREGLLWHCYGDYAEAEVVRDGR